MLFPLMGSQVGLIESFSKVPEREFSEPLSVDIMPREDRRDNESRNAVRKFTDDEARKNFVWFSQGLS
jgi:hypothetical protein